MPANDAIVLVAGFPPFQAKRVKYYEDPILAARAALPALELKPGGPYPYRPRPRPNQWTQAAPPIETRDVAPVAAPPGNPPNAGLVVPLEEPGVAAVAEEIEAEIEAQLQLDAEEQTLLQTQALDEHERVARRRPRRHIPL